ncbi:hypothetical protein [Moorena sp. SIOASIH]|nr:hypothetical protein [Moorena sp. SIOASIH]
MGKVGRKVGVGRWGDREIFIKGNYPDLILQGTVDQDLGGT